MPFTCYTLLMSSVDELLQYYIQTFFGWWGRLAANFGLPEPIFGLDQISMTSPLWQYTCKLHYVECLQQTTSERCNQEYQASDVHKKAYTHGQEHISKMCALYLLWVKHRQL